MGERALTFYVKHPSHREVAEVVQDRITAEAYVFPPINGWVCILDKSSNIQPEYEKIHPIIKGLSDKFQTVSIGFVVLSGVYFLYFLYDKGVLTSSFSSHSLDSIEDAFLDYPYGIPLNDQIFDKFLNIGDSARSLSHYCLATTRIEDICTVLESTYQSEDNMFEVPELDCVDAVYELAPMLGIFPEMVMLDFADYQQYGIESESVIEEFNSSDTIHILKSEQL